MGKRYIAGILFAALVCFSGCRQDTGSVKDESRSGGGRLAGQTMGTAARSEGRSLNGGKPASEVQAEPGEVTVVFMGELQGYLRPCHCTEGMIGGLPRMVTFVNGLRKQAEGPVIVVDFGNLVSGGSMQAQFKFTTILEIYNLLGVDALCLGERDLTLGSSFLAGQFMNQPELCVVGSNLVVKGMEELIKPYRFFQVQGLEVFVASLLDPELASGIPAVETGPPVKSVLKLQERAERAGLSILLARAGLSTCRKWAQKLPFFDVIVGGTGGEDPTALKKTASSFLVSPGSMGKYGTAITLKPGKGDLWKGELTKVTLGDKIEKDPAVLQLYKEYQLMLAQYEGELFTGKSPHPMGRFAGSQKCAACHPGASRVLSHSRHGTALESLEELGSDVDPECLKCHVTGYEYEGGFTSEEETPHLADVGCEECHGPGENHTKNPQASNIQLGGEDACRKCHTHLQSPGFEYEEYFRRIEHPEKDS